MADDDMTSGSTPGWPPPSEPTGPTDPGAAAPWSPPGSVPPAPAGPPPGSYAPPPGAAPPASGYGYPPAPGYGYPNQGFGGYAMPREHPQGTTVLILGICGWLICGLCAPFAWVMGNKAIKEIDQNPSAYTNRGLVQVGRILGMIYSILAVVGIAFLLVLLVIGAVAGSSS